MRQVTSVRALIGFKVWLRFDDGTEGELDLSHLAGKGVFAAWSDRSLFESVSLGPGRGITWPGDLDLCADSLYLRLTGKSLVDLKGAAVPVHA